jgi:cytidylate kinase
VGFLVNEAPVLALDGPGGSGKGTVASRIAILRHWRILDSGALYRAFAFSAQQLGVLPDDMPGIQRVLAETDFEFVVQKTGEVGIFVNGNDVTMAVRSLDAGLVASTYASQQSVRECLMSRQRFERQAPGLVADGRDMGTVVFPDATLKVFLTGTLKIRALRRYNQLIEKGFNATLAGVEQEVSARDQKDRTRVVSPLEPAYDAVVLDTTEIGIDQVVKKVDDLLTAKLVQSNNG